MISFRHLVPVVGVSVLAACSGGNGASRQEGRTATPAAADAAATPAPTAAGVCAGTGLARLEPVDGTYFGVSLDWDHDSPAAYSQRLGRAPSVYVNFAAFPIDEAAGRALDTSVASIHDAGGILLLTLEPNAGLATVAPAGAEDLGRRLARYNSLGVPVFVRFAHEMNGSWPWSQQPKAYIAAFRTVAEAVHRLAPGSAMLWSPNYGGGYPFSGGPHEAKPGDGEFAVLDTNGDGRLTMTDDPYAPYWPGDDAVDWVGMSLYHWGNQYPWGENEDPEPGKFVALVTGGYQGIGGDERAVPDFYAVYGDGQGKPVAITETAALFVPGRGGVAEDTLKRGWWRQVFDPTLPGRFPRLRMINWFEWDKQEREVGARVDWTVTHSPQLVAGFRRDLRAGLRDAGDDRCHPVAP